MMMLVSFLAGGFIGVMGMALLVAARINEN
ncbi:hypothetical protein CHR48_00395 [Weissella cibaria]|jgi:hypothetical protein|uniref:DUF3789 domain-containing protein n=1 Tax=Weissella cibaria TaxID=137591 RepID=A0A0D1K3L1_9LACO|nr:hypothetical protein AUC63_01689 [Weissella cibaria]APU63085.1 hypothetical protein AUC65_01295 [Weissella cibaria]APU65236.1 hypothetical protein AUC62_01288 [Weissella cibaria]ASS51387.1 hypothetical protein CHR48_00395 [Weissella cibaria]KIU19373.1 hypothetical protein ab3b_02401 [Weissella cibaria]